MKINYKWLIFNSFSAFVAAFLIQYYDAINYLLSLDHTYVSFIVLAQYIAICTYLGFKQEDSNFMAVRSYANLLPLVGMAGTLLAVMMVIFEAQTIGAKNIGDYHGLYSIFVTTFFGVFFLGLTKYQLALVYGEYKDAD